MPKKLSVSTLLLLYIVTALGFALNLHYCGNTITSVKIDVPAKPCGPEKMKCCHDKQVDVKVKDAHQTQAALVLARLFYVDIPKLPFTFHTLREQQLTYTISADRAPPNLCSGTPVYLKNCTFRI